MLNYFLGVPWFSGWICLWVLGIREIDMTNHTGPVFCQAIKGIREIKQLYYIKQVYFIKCKEIGIINNYIHGK